MRTPRPTIRMRNAKGGVVRFTSTAVSPAALTALVSGALIRGQVSQKDGVVTAAIDRTTGDRVAAGLRESGYNVDW